MECVEYLLKRKITCGYCGKPVSSESGTSKNEKIMRYYKCSGKRKDKTCPHIPIRKELLEQIVIDATYEALATPELIENIADRIMSAHKKRMQGASCLNLLEYQLVTIDNSIANLIKAMEQGIISQATKDRLNSLEQEKSDIQNKIAIEKQKEQLIVQCDDIVKYLKSAIKKEPRLMIQLIIKEVVLYNDKIEIHIDNNRVEATKGSVYVIPENFLHGYYSDDPDNFKILHILLSPYFLERYKDELNSIPGFTLLWDIEPLIREGSSEGMFLRLTEKQLADLTPIFDSLLENGEDKPENNVSELATALNIISKLSLLMLESHRSIEKKHSYAENADLFAIVTTIKYIKENYSDKINIETLLKIANMSKSNYIAKFKALSRYTPMEYLTEIRIEKAKEMLTDTKNSVSVIAQDCGFFDCSHFTSTFKKKTGMSPMRYRKENR